MVNTPDGEREVQVVCRNHIVVWVVVVWVVVVASTCS
jgi:hypothetical protein